MKILIIRFSSIGDIVLTSPVVRCAHLQLAAEIHYLTKSAYASILTSNPYIAQVHEWDPSSHHDVVKQLEEEQFDYILDLHKNIRSQRIKLALGTACASYPKLNWQKWIRVNLKYDLLPGVHIVDRYLKAAAALGVKNDHQGLDFHLAPATIQPRKRPYLAFAIGAAHATKRMTNDQIERLCAELAFPTVLLGGPEEKRLGEKIASKMAHIESLCGMCSIMESAHVIDQASLLLTHDTGMMHIGAARNKPMISIWGNTIPKFGMYPYFPSDSTIFSKTVEVSNLSCRPCSKIGHDTCPKKHFRCMNNHDIPAIGSLCNEFLSRGSRDLSTGKVFLS